jgi:hypothetical protein
MDVQEMLVLSYEEISRLAGRPVSPLPNVWRDGQVGEPGKRGQTLRASPQRLVPKDNHDIPQATGAMSGKRYLDQYEVEALYGIPHRTLEGWRLIPGEGPPWTRFGKKSIKYKVANLEAWIQRQQQGGDGVRAIDSQARSTRD